ncbi:MAG: rRNA maturation RNase YbeY [Thermus sp.]|nr:rRNA maturation RNase YbeY [Thermus sp.]
MSGERGVGFSSVSVKLTADRIIRALYLEWLWEDDSTDVLSFPHYEPGDPFMPPHLGDIWISLDAAKRQAVERGIPLEEEVLILAAHGLWHLLGHDHQKEEDWEGFRRVQERILTL